MMIKPAKISGLAEIFEIYQGCKQLMAKEGNFQWNESYPDIAVITNDISNRYLYCLYDQKDCIGAISINTIEDPEYSSVNWQDNAGKVMVVHRLAVKPLNQKQGIARLLMDFAEEHALNNGFTSIRLDAYSANIRALNLYEKRGFIKRGEVSFTGRDLPFYCYEKKIS